MLSHSHLIPMMLQHEPRELQKIIERREIDMKKNPGRLPLWGSEGLGDWTSYMNTY